MAWETRERWRRTDAHGTVWELWLSEIDDVFSHAWRVGWGRVGDRREGRSFTGERREHDARDFLAQRMADQAGDWEKID